MKKTYVENQKGKKTTSWTTKPRSLLLNGPKLLTMNWGLEGTRQGGGRQAGRREAEGAVRQVSMTSTKSKQTNKQTDSIITTNTIQLGSHTTFRGLVTVKQQTCSPQDKLNKRNYPLLHPYHKPDSIHDLLRLKVGIPQGSVYTPTQLYFIFQFF